MIGHRYPAAPDAAAPAMRRARAGSSMILRAKEANEAGSRPSTRKPVRPWATSERKPPTPDATTGVPQAADSSATRPKHSERLGTRHTSAAR